MRAYQIGVAYSLKNIARHLELPVFRTSQRFSILVYCFRGGKRSKLWTDTLETIGYKVDRLPAGWKGYRNWVRKAADSNICQQSRARFDSRSDRTCRTHHPTHTAKTSGRETSRKPNLSRDATQR